MVPCCLFSVFGSMGLMSVGKVGVMGGCVMIAGVVVLGGFGMMMGGHSVMMSGLTMMVRCLF